MGTVAAIDFKRNQVSGTAADDAMYAMADGLTAQGYEIRGPALDSQRYLKITNVQGIWCEITIAENGKVAWEHRSFDGGAADPELITDMVLVVLGSENAGYRSAFPVRCPGLTLTGVAGRALSQHGMRVRLGPVVPDHLCYQVYTEISATNPSRSERGICRVGDDGLVRWECRISEPAEGIQGLSLPDITATIARVLDSARCRQPS